MSDEAPAEEKPKGPPPLKVKTSKLVVLLLIFNLGATGFLVFQGMQQVNAVHDAAFKAFGDAQKSAHSEGPKDEVGPVTPLDPFIINLNEADASRYLKATFEVEVVSAEVIHLLEKFKRPIRDEVLRYLSGLSVADTQGEAGKAKIQKEVVARINTTLGGEKVRRLFFVEFVVQ